MDQTHDPDLRLVREGDTVAIDCGDGPFVCDCTDYQIQHADPRSGEVRETKIWEFTNVDQIITVSITDGLKSSFSQKDFPRHSPMYDQSREREIGYIETLNRNP